MPGAAPGDIVTVVWLSMIGGPSLAYMDVVVTTCLAFLQIMHLGAAWIGWVNYKQSLPLMLLDRNGHVERRDGMRCDEAVDT